MDLKLDSKIVLLTGATGGIGRQICLDFIEEHATVVCLVRSSDKFLALKEWLDSQSIKTENLHQQKANLLNKSELERAVQEITEKHKRIDVLINCAGSVEEVPFAMMDEDRIESMLNINLKGTMLITQAVLRPMFKQKAGAIVNISSITALKGGRGIVAYAAAKAGLDSFTRTLASEVGKKNIRVNSVRPGAIKTSMSKALEARVQDYIPNAMILGRFGIPSEVSKGVLFLSSEETASFITGTFLNIDGGYMV